MVVPAFAGMTLWSRVALFFFYAMVGVDFNSLKIDRAKMNTDRNPAQTGRQAPGVVARALRTPRTLAFPGLAR